MAIPYITSAERKIEAIYGFGSAFRGEPYRDIDVLAVVRTDSTPALDTYYELRSSLAAAIELYGVPLHLIVLTKPEFDSRPLRHMNQLVLLWSSET